WSTSSTKQAPTGRTDRSPQTCVGRRPRMGPAFCCLQGVKMPEPEIADEVPQVLRHKRSSATMGVDRILRHVSVHVDLRKTLRRAAIRRQRLLRITAHPLRLARHHIRRERDKLRPLPICGRPLQRKSDFRESLTRSRMLPSVRPVQRRRTVAGLYGSSRIRSKSPFACSRHGGKPWFS
ncbi:MAG: hypothetical protein JWR59_1972, partial [Brevundimonas sp.]|nr:hypothetical protein [Brevundimonas sp.]